MNEIIKILAKDGLVVFILKTEEDQDFWCWEVYRADVEDYDGTLEEFVNDQKNDLLGVSWGSFETVEEAIEDVGKGWKEQTWQG